MARKNTTFRWVCEWIMLGAGALGAGFLGQRTGLPAAWLVGPMVVAIVYALAKQEPPQNVPVSAAWWHWR